MVYKLDYFSISFHNPIYNLTILVRIFNFSCDVKYLQLFPECAPHSVFYILELSQLHHSPGSHFYRAESRGSYWDLKGNHVANVCFLILDLVAVTDFEQSFLGSQQMYFSFLYFAAFLLDTQLINGIFNTNMKNCNTRTIAFYLIFPFFSASSFILYL